MNKFLVDDHQMTYLDVGQGPVIIFGHSFLMDSQMWWPQVEMLSQQYRCIVPDFWAHGESQNAPPLTKTLKDYAKQIIALMDQIKVEQFSIVGLSLGGMWGAEIVGLVPERVQSLVLMDTFVGLEPEVAYEKCSAMLENISSAQRVSQAIIEALIPIFFARNAEQNTPELVAYLRRSLSNIKGDRAIEIARIGQMVFGRRDQFSDIEQFDLPVLIAVGQEDVARPVLESFLMHDSIAGSELVQIPQAGHISNLEQPEFVSRMLLTFFAKVFSDK
ncbi:2-succinyl-6-hydroxy-2,4-cyclohexadiene-1-carboxy late synthase [Vibrio zhanjiangensis]|uniref:2-succinyl-6-hydroxy-2, 4-cyclohexadiene-1-carboxy late synthase n=1 Tax=Vibrio zhanjiangensis TaxID=1046128 RepID=A0ABQ6F3L8_9VIBR|nr:alpha/beta fold hydrolase [Vibrio zhanjiangensis]GLT20128.1 2-succinyl-6-hydroxy-2,4-cyclohexadiene-1-carboxy late synthase [Vibrio zhanjiangensis]